MRSVERGGWGFTKSDLSLKGGGRGVQKEAEFAHSSTLMGSKRGKGGKPKLNFAQKEAHFAHAILEQPYIYSTSYNYFIHLNRIQEGQSVLQLILLVYLFVLCCIVIIVICYVDMTKKQYEGLFYLLIVI